MCTAPGLKPELRGWKVATNPCLMKGQSTLMSGTLRFSHIIHACMIVVMDREYFPNGTNQLAFLMKMLYCFHYNQLMHKYLCISWL